MILTDNQFDKTFEGVSISKQIDSQLIDMRQKIRDVIEILCAKDFGAQHLCRVILFIGTGKLNLLKGKR